jgi:DNA-binding MarR family transcriptional regulator
MSSVTSDDLDLCMRVRKMCACNQLRRATRGITQLYESEMASGGLKVTQLPILVALRTEGDLSVTRLANALSLDRTTLTRNLRVLEQRGFVTMQEDGDDGRLRMASLTAEGARILPGALECWEEVQNVVEERFGEPRLRALYEELAALAEAVGPSDEA